MSARDLQSNGPQRITDLINARTEGAMVSCRLDFEILPVEFTHRDQSFHAYVFLCRYAGEIDGRPYSFRKCYGRGCKHNKCLHVAQAVMIANRFLERDYRRLREAGIDPGEQRFVLEDMMVQFDRREQDQGPQVLDIYDFINQARAGNDVGIESEIEYVPAVEYFEGRKESHVFLMGRFTIHCLGETRLYERCFSCYPSAGDQRERDHAAAIADARLHLLYRDFKEAGVHHQPVFFK
ncbi:MAG: hypothetical protein AUK55_14565 [Syntrophobacteraceae bacterium CG2_30_61_12]|nr:MAG: hypothetical protein AUK55_14565 [Syntrophobacteraceae bacterium CG2_30_61_12]